MSLVWSWPSMISMVPILKLTTLEREWPGCKPDQGLLSWGGHQKLSSKKGGWQKQTTLWGQTALCFQLHFCVGDLESSQGGLLVKIIGSRFASMHVLSSQTWLVKAQILFWRCGPIVETFLHYMPLTRSFPHLKDKHTNSPSHPQTPHPGCSG